MVPSEGAVPIDSPRLFQLRSGDGLLVGNDGKDFQLNLSQALLVLHLENPFNERGDLRFREQRVGSGNLANFQGAVFQLSSQALDVILHFAFAPAAGFG